jgi:hypothetical protein
VNLRAALALAALGVLDELWKMVRHGHPWS